MGALAAVLLLEEVEEEVIMEAVVAHGWEAEAAVATQLLV